MAEGLRERLVAMSLEWEQAYGIAPAITGALAEYDAARLVGISDADFQRAVGGASAVRRGYDFEWEKTRYQVKANRPSGKHGSRVTLVGKVGNYNFDVLIWILYDQYYVIQEAWHFSINDYRTRFEALSRVRPIHMRQGANLLP